MGDKFVEEYDIKLDYWRLLNLHKALLEAKFHTNPDNELVAGSPLVADVYIQIRELLLQSDKSEEWKEWFQLKNRSDWKRRAILLMKKDHRWKKASSEKRKIAGDYLAPFIYSEIELDEVVAEADEISMV